MLASLISILGIMLTCILAPFSFAQEKGAAPQPPKVAHQGYPVRLGGQVLFYVKEDVKGYSPKERAETISERIKIIADDPDIPVRALIFSDFNMPMTLVSVGDKMLFPVFDQDASAEGLPREQLAREYADQVRLAVEKYREDRNRKAILYGAFYTLLATAAFAAFLIFTGKLKRKIDRWIAARVAARAKGAQKQSFEILRAERVKSILLEGVKGIWFFLILLSLYSYLHSVLSFFPWTRPFAGRVLDYVLVPLTAIGEAITANISNVVFVMILVLIARYLLRVIKFFFLGVERGTVKLSGFYPEWAKPTYKILSWLVIAFFAIVAFPYIPGSESPAFKGVSIFVGILFSLGSQSTVSNMIAGLALTYRRAFKIGDRVKIGDFTGDVVETRLQVTTLRTVKNEDIVVPNGLIMNGPVINYSAEAREQGLILHTTVTIGYDAPWRRVHELLLKAAEKTEGVLREPAPFILQKSLDDFYVTYELNAYTDKPQRMAKTYSLLHQNIQDAFNEGGVEIMSPHYTQLRDGNKVTLPEPYLPKDYVPGALRFLQTGNAGESRPGGETRPAK